MATTPPTAPVINEIMQPSVNVPTGSVELTDLPLIVDRFFIIDSIPKMVDENGTIRNSGNQFHGKNTTHILVTGLTPNTKYVFNVLVRDMDENATNTWIRSENSEEVFIFPRAEILKPLSEDGDRLFERSGVVAEELTVASLEARIKIMEDIIAAANA